MHTKIMERINAIQNLKQSEMDDDLRIALSSIVELFTSFPSFGKDAQQLVVLIDNMIKILDDTDAGTARGKAARVVMIKFLRIINPKLGHLGLLVSEVRTIVTELRNEIEDGSND